MEITTSVETPIGLLQWDGALTEGTMILFPDGMQAPLYGLISHTNGAVFEWLKDYL